MRSAATQLPAQSSRRLVLALLGIALLCGCTSLEWQRAGVSAEVRDRELAGCTTQARAASLREVSTIRAPGQRVVIDRAGRAVPVQQVNQDNERFMFEQDHLRACMRERGYTLQEADAAAR